MLITATQKFTRQSPRKVRLVANAVKKLPLDKALQQLAIIERKSTLVLMKTVKQAIANAINNHGLKFSELSIDTITVTPGPTYKRMRAVSRGRGHEIKKRTSHIMVRLKTLEAQSEVKPVAQAKAVSAPVATQPATQPTASTPAKKATSSKTKKEVKK